MTGTYPPINWVTFEGDFNDYRPAIGPDGQKVVFERTYPNKPAKLYYAQSIYGSEAVPFLKDQPDGQIQTRPDWTGEKIALNIGPNDNITVQTANDDGKNLNKLENDSLHYFYPQWAVQLPFIGFVVMNSKDASAPHSTLLNRDGKVVIDDLNGKDANGDVVWGGMPAVFPDTTYSVAFAGQPGNKNWNGLEGYHENFNYIFINKREGEFFTSSPMEPSAPIDAYNGGFQGRAPAIAPDGKYVAFESNRCGYYAIYLFNLQEPRNSPIQLTGFSDTPNAQHPKFFPDGKKLIFCAVPEGKLQSRIAWIDISEFL